MNLINDILEAQAQLRLSKLETTLSKCNLVILDELGFIPFSKEGARKALFAFSAARYERGSLIITTNLEFARWKEIFGDEALTGSSWRLDPPLPHHQDEWR
jgi:DNA replication protein DnaC